MAMIETISDADIERALIESQGQPVAAAKILDVTYPHLYTRIRKNPALYEIQKSYRGKTFQDLSNLATVMAMAGIIREPKTDEETGEVIEGEFVNKKVDYRTRQNMILSLMNTFKGDEGIKDTLVVENQNGINLNKMSDAGLAELMAAMSDSEEEIEETETEETNETENEDNLGDV